MIQSEISLEQLYRIIAQLPFEQRLTLADEIKREIMPNNHKSHK